MKLLSLFVAGVIVSFVLAGATAGQRTSLGERQRADRVAAPGGGGAAPEILDEITDEQRAEVQASVAETVQRLGLAGRLPETSPQAVLFNWPLRRANLTDFNIEGISNYVDQNPAVPNQLMDWNCGARSYDLSSGYNHRGVDIFTWPFGWYKMDNQQAEIVAAAAGTIVNRADGNFDRNCAMGSSDANYIIVRHDDGSTAWYWHMKNGSVTPKQVGDTVGQGEYLGVAGSSGSSTGPHLHFEIYNAANQLQDPYAGACNSLNAFTYWANQEPYRNSRINSLQTGSAPAQMPACPTQETPNIDYTLSPGATAYFTGYYRDQTQGSVTQFQLLRPDGSVYTNWSQTSPNTYNASWWYWFMTMPASPTGTWTFRATYNGQTYDRKFALGPPSSSSVTISGRAMDTFGRGIRNARLVLTNSTTGATYTSTTGTRGQYAFQNVPSGAVYTLTLVQRRFDFGNTSRTIEPVENMSGVDIFARN